MSKLAEYCKTCGDRGTEFCSGDCQDCARAITNYYISVVIPEINKRAEEAARIAIDKAIELTKKVVAKELIEEIENTFGKSNRLFHTEQWQQLKQKRGIK
jgi:hypothetical protein